ncbi:MAG: endonuclease [Planctomycetes bacterium]|nr:endonuclease [Planctomycetota bacterium]
MSVYRRGTIAGNGWAARWLGFVFCLIGLAGSARAQYAQYAPPEDYYGTVTGSVATLKSELHLIISSDYWNSRTGPGGTFVPNGYGHRVRTYDQARQALPIVDGDPDQPGNIILAYNGASVPGAWDSGATWNREHRWPDSIGLGSSGPDYSDMFQLTGCNPSINSSRGNNPFGTPSSSGTYGHVGSYWYPGDADRPGNPDVGNDTGDVARVGFYMAVRYDGGEPNTFDLELTNGLNGTNQLGDKAALLVWHYQDVPSAFEQRRNHLLFSSVDNPAYYQGNRNPFIDHPEYVWAIFGEAPNDSTLYVGASLPADGASSLLIDFGTLAVGAALPAPQGVTLNKAGTAPTYYAATVSGIATCDVAGRNNAFGHNAGSRVLAVGLPADTTATAGVKTGTITIDNLDLTNQGAGTGSLDGDDTIQVTVNVIGVNCPVPFADSDRDGDVDQTDFADLQLCYSGEEPYTAGCACFDRDGSGTIDSADFDAFHACYGGPGLAVPPTCGQ